MKLILARHGNTFGPGDNPVWVGAKNDLPLVEKGKSQAISCGSYLKHKNITPTAIYTAPLKRTYEFGAIVHELLGQPIHIQQDPALTEIDYGRWSGKSNDQIIKTFGEQPLKDWQERGIWPQNADWHPSEEAMINQILSFSEKLVTQHANDEAVMAVSSNGVLRYFLMLADGAFEEFRKGQDLKVKTGHICQFTYDGTQFHLDFWNANPDEERA